MSDASPKISMIAAMADNRVIGIRNELPWRLPADMKWFRQHTLGKPIIMGRKTYDSFGGKSLPQRHNIVVTHDKDYQAEDASIVHSIEQAIELAGDVAEIMVIGGASFYAQMLDKADRLYLTYVHTRVEGDAWFPEFDINLWQEQERHEHQPDEKNPHSYSFVILDKKFI